ncbi:MAG: bacillithiol system redox-active protein YtxJ [Chitinophagaceae bacterium]
MQWIPLTEAEQLDHIVVQSHQQPILIFKHSTRCPISSMALARVENANYTIETPCYFLDLIAFRSLSNQVANQFAVYHESPQVLIIKNGECIYDESHNGIRIEEISEELNRKN